MAEFTDLPVLGTKGVTPFARANAALEMLLGRPWVNVRDPDYGAVGDGVADDTVAIRAAAAALATMGGGVMLVPPGTYRLATGTQVDLASNVIVQGCGRSSLFKRDGPGVMVFRINGSSHVTVRDTACDFNGAPEFFRYIGLRGASPKNIRIENNRVFDTNPVRIGGGDKWAFELSAESGVTENVWVVGNHTSDDMQCTAGGASIRNYWITDNYLFDGTSNGIAVTQLGSGSIQENITIARNKILRPKGLGIIVGPDNPEVVRTGCILRDVHVHDNQVFYEGTITTPLGIEVRHQNTFENVSIHNNKVIERGARNSGEGIRVVRSGASGTAVADSVRVSNNTVRGFANGIHINHSRDVVVAENIGRDITTTIRVTEVPGLTVIGNACAGVGSGISLTNCTDTLVTANNVRGATTAFAAGLRVVSNTAVEVTAIGNRFVDGGASVNGIKQEGAGTFDTHYIFNDVRGNAGGGINLAAGTAISWMNQGAASPEAPYPLREFTASKIYDPPSLAAGAVATDIIGVTGAAMGDVVSVTHSGIGDNAVLISGHVSVAGVVRYTLVNHTGAVLDIPSGTTRVVVRRPA